MARVRLEGTRQELDAVLELMETALDVRDVAWLPSRYSEARVYASVGLEKPAPPAAEDRADQAPAALAPAPRPRRRTAARRASSRGAAA